MCCEADRRYKRLIERRVGKRLSIWTVGHYLHKWGFTAKRTVRRAFQYSKRGERAVISGTGQRFRCAMVSAITHMGLLL